MNPTIFPNTEKIDFSKKLKIKFGIDPTSDKLHLGHLLPLLLVKKLWLEGHDVSIVLGTFTAQLGDPSGKDTMRPILTAEETKLNSNSIKDQIFRVFLTEVGENKSGTFTIQKNHFWFDEMTASQMTSILSKFTTTQLLARDSFQKRMEAKNPIGLHELVVPILQGYDSVHLKTDVEIGGTDQLFNFAISRDMQRLHGQIPEVCMLMPIINGTDGRKMSKSFDNCIFLNDKPHDVYGKVMSISDELMKEWWPMFFDVEIINMQFPMEEKKKLAFQVTSKIWSFDDASKAAEHFEQTIQNKELPEEMLEIPAVIENRPNTITEIVMQMRQCSKNEAKRLMTAGAVTVEGAKVDPDFPIFKAGLIIKVGKRNFAKTV